MLFFIAYLFVIILFFNPLIFIINFFLFIYIFKCNLFRFTNIKIISFIKSEKIIKKKKSFYGLFFDIKLIN